MAKINFEDKEDVKLSSLPRKNKVIATDINEIKQSVNDLYDEKQDKLVSGTNIKTINSESLLGSGNITINSQNLATNNLTQTDANRTYDIGTGNRTLKFLSGSNEKVNFHTDGGNPTIEAFKRNAGPVIKVNKVSGAGNAFEVVGGNTTLERRLELNSVTNGFLMNRVTTIQMNAIATPSTNELVFNTDLNALYRYNGSSWVALSSGYGIIGVYSGTGNGTPTFFATLQSALETCKASGGYFTVKLYSNLTITSAIEIDYTGSGTGNAYLFRQLTIDFNGFSITNAQANTSDAFTIELSNSASVYQNITFLNGVVLRTNGTGTHHALKINQSGRFGTVQMSKMLWYCENSIAMSLALQGSTSVNSNKICDLGGSTFISNINTAINFNSNLVNVINFNALSRGSENTVTANNGNLSFFTVENTSTGNALNITSLAVASNFNAYSNSGSAVRINTGIVINFSAISVTGIGVNANIANCTVDNFYAKTGNNFAIQVLGSFDNNSNFSNGKCENNGATECAQFQNFGSAHNIEATNYGSGVGLDIRNGQESRCEVTSCKGISIGGIGCTLSSSSASSVVSIDNCYFNSHWNNLGGHALRISNSTGVILLTKSHLKVRNADANAINATASRTIRSRYCTDNEVATNPVNANVTVVASRIIS